VGLVVLFLFPHSRYTDLAEMSHLSRRSLLLFALVSILLLVPCFWHHHIQAGDLGSHTYNAWLAQLIQQGKAPGLFLAWQWDNILFDLLLFYLSKVAGFTLAEKLAVSLCVLAFFWGVFAFVDAATRRPPWQLTPLMAMLSYGYVFNMGYMNYYLSIGLGCFSLAFLWPGKPRGLIVALLLLPLVYLAHPLGVLLVVSVGAYRLAWPLLKGGTRLILPAISIVIFCAVHWIALRHPELEGDWPDAPFYQWNGTDQYNVYGQRYVYLSWVILVLALCAVVFDEWRSGRRSAIALTPNRKNRWLLLEFYLISFCAMMLFPENLRPQPGGSWIGGIVTRLTLISAIFALALLGSLRPRRWHLLGCVACAACYFVFLYQDTGVLDRLEKNSEAITHQLPFGTRVASSVYAPPGYRPFYMHLIDRSCIGHCFLISNYEPSTLKFRVRVEADGSPLVVSTVDDSETMQFGNYFVQPEDLPLKQIYQCDSSDLARLCIRELAAGELNGRLGYKPHFPWDKE
jgi:hypothetical protein